MRDTLVSPSAKRLRRISVVTASAAVATEACAVAFRSVSLAVIAFALLAWSSWGSQVRFAIRYALRCKD